MVQILQTVGLLLSTVSILVSAAPAPIATAAPDLSDAVALHKRTSCTFTAASAVTKSKTSCATIVLDGITVPSGVTLDLTGLTKGTEVIFEGTTTWEYEEWTGPLISVSGTDIKVTGASGHVLNGNGASWWDGKGSNGGKTKPKFFFAHGLLGASSITGLSIENTPVQCFSIDRSTGLTISDVTINNKAADSLGRNTDAFDIADSSDITITGATVYNQDDCLAINSGTSITFTGGLCSGGHGLSIGSVGGHSDNTVETVVIESSTVEASQNGVRIKTVSGATGTVKGVSYKNITLKEITEYGIIIEQDYENGSPTGTPTAGVPITDLVIEDVTGTVTSAGTNIYILCASGACSSWTWSGVSVTGGATSSKCENIPTGASCS